VCFGFPRISHEHVPSRPGSSLLEQVLTNGCRYSSPWCPHTILLGHWVLSAIGKDLTYTSVAEIHQMQWHVSACCVGARQAAQGQWPWGEVGARGFQGLRPQRKISESKKRTGALKTGPVGNWRSEDKR